MSLLNKLDQRVDVSSNDLSSGEPDETGNPLSALVRYAREAAACIPPE